MFEYLLNSGNYMDIYIIARWMYKIGEPILTEEAYDAIEQYVKLAYPDCIYLQQTWSEDLQPYDLLEEYEIELTDDTAIDFSNYSKGEAIEKYLDKLKDNKSLSITPMRSYDSIYEWCEKNAGLYLCASTKIDGLNSKTIIDAKTGAILATGSRGRHDRDILDYTMGAIKKYKGFINIPCDYKSSETCSVFAEMYVDKDGMELAREADTMNRKFRSERATALSLLTAGGNNELYEHLHMCVFNHDAIQGSLYYSLSHISTLGYEIPPIRLVNYPGMSYDEFVIWLDKLMEDIYEETKQRQMPSDGMVLQIDNPTDFHLQESNNLYHSGNIAVKVGPWKAKKYTSRVVKIIIGTEKGTKELKSVRLKIEPVEVSNGDIVEYVGGFNLGFLQRAEIFVGTDIEFIHQSGAVGILEGRYVRN